MALELWRQYLSGRSQRVQVNNSYSNWEDINVGVPQGSILGPNVFILYINDLFEEVQLGAVFPFADYTAMLVSK